MKTKCPHCQGTFTTKDENVGKNAQCPQCAQRFTIAPHPTGFPSEMCSRCGREIGQTEQAYVLQGNVVCEKCNLALRRLSVSRRVERLAGAGSHHSTTDHDKAKIERNEQAESRVSIILPYSIRNIVFIQSLLPWCWIVMGLLMTSLQVLTSLQESEAERREFPGGIVLVIVGGVFMVVGWWGLWKWALRGYRWAVIVLYVLYVPSVAVTVYFLGLAILDTLSSAAQYGLYSVLGWGIGVVINLAVILTLVVNLYEQGLWDFVNLGGRCPVCQRWRFGSVRRPCEVKCQNCGSILEFTRAD